MTSLATRFAIGAMALTALGACVPETDEEREQKETLVKDMVEQSVDLCDMEGHNFAFLDYSERLEKLLKANTLASLSFLNDNGIIVCLDDRLDVDNVASILFTKDPVALYYPENEGREQRVLSIRDDGGYPGDPETRVVSSFFLNHLSAESLGHIQDIEYVYQKQYGFEELVWNDAPDDFYSYRNTAGLDTPPFSSIVEEIVEEIPDQIIDDASEAVKEEIQDFGANGPG